jgi:hypothetical protein
VAYSRVYTGVHFPGDVIIGLLVGAAIGRAVARCPVDRLGDLADGTRLHALAPAAAWLLHPLTMGDSVHVNVATVALVAVLAQLRGALAVASDNRNPFIG